MTSFVLIFVVIFCRGEEEESEEEEVPVALLVEEVPVVTLLVGEVPVVTLLVGEVEAEPAVEMTEGAELASSADDKPKRAAAALSVSLMIKKG